MNSSPMTIRMIELRISSDPTVGPTVTTLRGSPAPNRAISCFSSVSNFVPGMTGAGVGLGDSLALAEADAEAEAPAEPLGSGVGLGLGVGLGDGSGVTPEGRGDGVGTGVEAGRRSIGVVRISRNPL